MHKLNGADKILTLTGYETLEDIKAPFVCITLEGEGLSEQSIQAPDINKKCECLLELRVHYGNTIAASGGTKVLTPTGFKRIDDLKYYDVVSMVAGSDLILGIVQGFIQGDSGVTYTFSESSAKNLVMNGFIVQL